MHSRCNTRMLRGCYPAHIPRSTQPRHTLQLGRVGLPETSVVGGAARTRAVAEGHSSLAWLLRAAAAHSQPAQAALFVHHAAHLTQSATPAPVRTPPA